MKTEFQWAKKSDNAAVRIWMTEITKNGEEKNMCSYAYSTELFISNYDNPSGGERFPQVSLG